jgi:hypothetical protein
MCIRDSVFVDVKRCFSLFLAIYEVLFHLRFSDFCCCNNTAEVFFFFFPCVLCFYHGVLWRELCKFVWNEKSYSSLSLSLSIYIYIYISNIKIGILYLKASPF